MQKRVIVISLSGSLIVPEKVDYFFLNKLKKTLRKNYKKYKFVVVCGGGAVAREYISILKKEGKSQKEQSLAGIRATRMNALVMIQFFGKEANAVLPNSIKKVKDNLAKNNVVFCGALKYAKNETSDGTAAKIARYFKVPFINITDVSGLYTSNPKENKKAKLISNISWGKFEKMALKIKFSPGQHFVSDQNTASIIKKSKIPTFIIGKNLNNLDKLLNGKKFAGTTISR